MTDRVEEVARIIADHTGADPDDGYAEEVPINPRKLAQAIHDAGLLAPATAQTQWGIQISPTDWIYTRRGAPMDREDAERMIVERGRVDERLMHRFVTDWEET